MRIPAIYVISVPSSNNIFEYCRIPQSWRAYYPTLKGVRRLLPPGKPRPPRQSIDFRSHSSWTGRSPLLVVRALRHVIMTCVVVSWSQQTPKNNLHNFPGIRTSRIHCRMAPT